ncbi:unnamed protein product, partial [Meganyctiphanes norvegica]
VTWMQQSNLHILTANKLVFSSDDRFKVIHSINSSNWILKIQNATYLDAGIYECQVNSDPKVISQVLLQIEAPPVYIKGRRELYVGVGGILSLICICHHTDFVYP